MVAIRISQPGKPPVLAGKAREDLSLSVPIVLEALSPVAVTAYRWSIIYKPPSEDMTTNSAAALTSNTAPTTEFTPDNRGTYLIELWVNTGSGLGARPSDRTRITCYAGPALASDPAALPRRRIAAHEALEHNVPDSLSPLGNDEGWAREWEKWFRVIEGTKLEAAAALSAAGSAQADVGLLQADLGYTQADVLALQNKLPVVQLFSGVASNATTTPIRIGAGVINPTDFTSVVFHALLETDDSGVPATVYLYDVLAGSIVAASVLTESAMTPQERAVNISVPMEMLAEPRIYELHLVSALDTVHQARCLGAWAVIL